MFKLDYSLSNRIKMSVLYYNISIFEIFYSVIMFFSSELYVLDIKLSVNGVILFSIKYCFTI